ncbi:hypothetical protein TKK_0008077 [Trichogramma kaykai]
MDGLRNFVARVVNKMVEKGPYDKKNTKENDKLCLPCTVKLESCVPEKDCCKESNKENEENSNPMATNAKSDDELSNSKMKLESIPYKSVEDNPKIVKNEKIESNFVLQETISVSESKLSEISKPGPQLKEFYKNEKNYENAGNSTPISSTAKSESEQVDSHIEVEHDEPDQCSDDEGIIIKNEKPRSVAKKLPFNDEFQSNCALELENDFLPECSADSENGTKSQSLISNDESEKFENLASRECSSIKSEHKNDGKDSYMPDMLEIAEIPPNGHSPSKLSPVLRGTKRVSDENLDQAIPHKISKIIDSDSSSDTENEEDVDDNYSDFDPQYSDDETDETYSFNITFDNTTTLVNPTDEINFDVNSIINKPSKNFSIKGLGDGKRRSEYYCQQRLTLGCIKTLYTQLKSCPQTPVESDPVGLKIPLLPHQRDALKWLMWRESQKPSGGILADDMGLGKTMEIISLLVAKKTEKQKYIIRKDENDKDDDDDWGFYPCSRKRFDGGTLVICQVSVIKQWEREISVRCRRNILSSFVYHGPDKRLSAKTLSTFDVVITTYGIIAEEYEEHVEIGKREDSRLFKINWDRVILDEAHYIRNNKTKASSSVCELTTNHRWVLTGTPIQNSVDDFYALLKFLKCEPFDNWSVWRRWVSNRNETGGQRLTVLIKALMLRRTKEELIKKNLVPDLPEKQIEIIEVNLDMQEKIVYQKLLLYSQTFFLEFLRQRKKKDAEKGKPFSCYSRPKNIIRQEVPKKMTKLLRILMAHHNEIGQHDILVLILRLRQICCHPSLIRSMIEKEDIQVASKECNESLNADINELLLEKDDSDDEDECYDIDEVMVKKVMSSSNPIFSENRQSSKVTAILSKIEDILERGEKVIVVSQWTSFLSLIGRLIKKTIPHAVFAHFFGSTKIQERQEIVDRINDRDDNLNVLLLSLTAGGCGINLIGANNLLLVDLHWNPQWETQAQDRIYRFGQIKDVRIYKFVCKNTIEENIKALQEGKLKISSNVLSGTVGNNLTIEDLHVLFSLNDKENKRKNRRSCTPLPSPPSPDLEMEVDEPNERDQSDSDDQQNEEDSSDENENDRVVFEP